MVQISFRTRIGILLALIVVLIWQMLIALPTPLQRLHGSLLDVRLALSAPSFQKSDDVVLVLIDSESLQKLAYTDPVDRSFLAGLLRQIQAANPKAIGLTLRLNRPTEIEKDVELAQVMGDLSVPFFSAADLSDAPGSQRVPGFVDHYLPSGSGAFVLPELDSDGVARRYWSGKQGLAWQLAQVDPPGDSLPIVRLVRTANLWQGPFARYQAHLLNEVKPEWLAGKTVIIGLDVPGRDRVHTAWQTWVGADKGQISLAEFHAHALSNIMGNRLLYPLWWLWQTPLLWLFAGVALFAGLASWSTRAKLVSMIALMCGWTLLSHLFYINGLVVGLLVGWGSIATAMATGLVWFNKDAWPQLKFIRRIIRLYIAPELRFNMLKKPTNLHTVDQTKDLVLLSAQWQLCETAHDMNRVHQEFSRVCTSVADHGGFIVSVQSGQLLAVFNAPVDLMHYQSRANTCAIRLMSLFDQCQCLHDLKVQLIAGQGNVGPCPQVRPGGYWVSGKVYNDLLNLQKTHLQYPCRLLTDASLTNDLRDPNWEFVEVEPKQNPPLFTVRLAANYLR